MNIKKNQVGGVCQKDIFLFPVESKYKLNHPYETFSSLFFWLHLFVTKSSFLIDEEMKVQYKSW